MPFRPIVSSVNSPTYSISSLIADILSKSYVDSNSYNVKDSFEFVEQFQNFQLPEGHKIISLDVKSLFTNIPLDLVLHILHRDWHRIECHTQLSQSSFFKIIDFITNYNYFSFDNKIYSQIDGMAMGSPVSPIFANLVMDFYIDNVMKVLPFQFSFFKKYVDDLICGIPEEAIEEVVDIFNSFHPNIQYTLTLETDGGVPFLDTQLFRNNNNQIIIDWYQKPSNSGRFLNFFSNHSITQKINLVKGMKNRLNLISHPSLLHKNLNILSKLFQNNGYPKSLVNKILFNNQTQQAIDTKPKPDSGPKYCKFPYIPQIVSKIKNVFASEHIKLAFYNYHPLKKYFSRIKDTTKLEYKSNLIYSIPCKDCDQQYVGQTSNWLKQRLTAHKSDINTKKKRCALAIHMNTKNHKPDFDNVTIRRTIGNRKSREFVEMVEINRTPNNMNFRSDVNNLHVGYSYLLSLDSSKNTVTLNTP